MFESPIWQLNPTDTGYLDAQCTGLGYKQGLRLFTKLLAEHPLVGICRPSDPLPAETLKTAGHMGGSIYIRGHSAGSYAGMVWETILAEFPNIEGRTVLTAIAFPPALLTRSMLSYNRQVHLIHHADDRLCVWNPSRQDMKLLQQQRFKITRVTGWRAYLGNAQHNYAHWTRVSLPEGCHDLADLERMPGVLPFEVYAQAPLRLLSWCSFELNHVAFFPSNAFMAFARSFNMFIACCQLGLID